MIEQGLFQLVTSDPAVKAAVGVDANGTTRAYWILAPQGSTTPFLVFSRVGTLDTYDMAGTTGIREGEFQIVCYATTYYASRNVAEAVRACIKDYIGILPDANSTVVQGVFLTKDWDARYEEGSTGFIYGAYLQCKIWYLG